ncbi:MAG: AAA family ATPase [Phycisphaerales bacterium]|jgi:DNA polymerase III subunit delta'|nr:AAA family ATPase [Phycisphaerales bacterium]
MAKRTTKKKPVLKKLPSEKSAPPLQTYDPQIPLTSVIGQHHAMDILNRSMQSQRVHHAWIFHGPTGVGKFTSAIAWASTILDPTSTPDLSGNIVPDPESSTQQLIRSQTHPDLHVIRKEMARYHHDSKVRSAKLASIPKAIVEEHLINPAALAASMKSTSLVSKVFIVDESELLNSQTQNAILKTLEEPPPGTVIILVTSNEDRLLPTIRSRCQRVAFAPLDDDAMRAWIASTSLEPTPEEHQWLLSTSNGSPGRYKEAHEAGIYQWSTDLEPLFMQCDQGRYPLTLGPRMNQLVDDWAKDWVKQGEKIGENRSKLVANQLGTQHMLSLIAGRYRKQLTVASKAHRALHAIDMVGRAQHELNTNVQLRFVMDHLAAGLSEEIHSLV